MSKVNDEKIKEILIMLTVFLMCTSVYFQWMQVPIYILSLGLVVILILTNKNTIINLEYKTVFLSFWMIYATFQLIMLQFNKYAFNYYIYLICNIVVFLILSRLKNKMFIRKINKTIILGLVINLLIGFWEVFTGNHIKILTEDYLRRFANIPVSFYSNANDFATFLLCSLFIINLECIISNNTKYKITLYILNMVNCILIYFTESRAGIYGIIICVIFNLSFNIFMKAKVIKKTIITIIIITVGIILPLTFNSVVEKVVEGLGRIELWKNVIDNFINSYFIGIGPGQSMYMGGNVHFIILEILVEYGLIIFCGAIIMYINIIHKTMKSKENKKIVVQALSFFVLLIPMSISSSSITRIPIVWVVISIFYFLTASEQGGEFT